MHNSSDISDNPICDGPECFHGTEIKQIRALFILSGTCPPTTAEVVLNFSATTGGNHITHEVNSGNSEGGSRPSTPAIVCTVLSVITGVVVSVIWLYIKTRKRLKKARNLSYHL